jgi:hypothetical protein
VSNTNRPDIQIWRRTLNGVFSVRSAYHLAKEKEDGWYPKSSLRKEISVIWSGIWRLQISNVGKNFMWRACQSILPTKDNLVKRKIIQDPLCPICGLEPETSFHILWDCPSARDVWGVSLRVFQKRVSHGP